MNAINQRKNKTIRKFLCMCKIYKLRERHYKKNNIKE